MRLYFKKGKGCLRSSLCTQWRHTGSAKGVTALNLSTRSWWVANSCTNCLTPTKVPMIPTQEKDGWAQEPVGLLWGTEKPLAPVRNHPAHSLTTIPSSLPKCTFAPACTNARAHTPHTHNPLYNLKRPENVCQTWVRRCSSLPESQLHHFVVSTHFPMIPHSHFREPGKEPPQ